MENELHRTSSGAADKRSLYLAITVSIGIVAALIGYVWYKVSEKHAAQEAAKPVWHTVKTIAVSAICRETHANESSAYRGNVEWMIETKTGAERTFALLMQDSDERIKWLQRSMDSLTKAGVSIYTPPSSVVMTETGHILPTSGRSSSLSDKPPPSYPVVCSDVQVRE